MTLGNFDDFGDFDGSDDFDDSFWNNIESWIINTHFYIFREMLVNTSFPT